MKHKVLSTITIHQISSLYYSFTRKQDDVVITLSNFNSDFKGWIVDYNESREDQPLRLGKSELTCFDIGWYEVILHYETGFDDSCPFGINNSSESLPMRIGKCCSLVPNTRALLYNKSVIFSRHFLFRCFHVKNVKICNEKIKTS